MQLINGEVNILHNIQKYLNRFKLSDSSWELTRVNGSEQVVKC